MAPRKREDVSGKSPLQDKVDNLHDCEETEEEIELYRVKRERSRKKLCKNPFIKGCTSSETDGEAPGFEARNRDKEKCEKNWDPRSKWRRSSDRGIT